MLNRIWRKTCAVTAIEYALIASLVSVVSLGVLTIVGVNLSNVFQSIADKL